MSVTKIRDKVYFVGAVDWDVRVFHGYETPCGATYNAYLILDDAVTLVDTVKAGFSDELFRNIEEILPISEIKHVIVNHMEPDHSGALPLLTEKIPNAKLYGTAAALKGLKAYYKKEFENFVTVKAGDTLNTGKYTYSFVPMPMVHWPDSMATYFEAEKILFSNDALGQHLASNERYDDEIGLSRLIERAGDYYANIVLPFGRPPVEKLLKDLSALDVSLVCPSHGVMLRTYIPEMLAKYTAWAKNETDENKAVVLFDTMWGATEKMAEKIAADFRAEGKTVELIDLRVRHVSFAMARLLEARTIAVGCPTLNRNVMPGMSGFLTYMRGLAPKDRMGLPFGAYGWSGESIGQIKAAMEELGWEVLPKQTCLWMP